MLKVKNTGKGKADAACAIKDLQNRAFGLKHFGEDIKKVYNDIESRKRTVPDFAQGVTRSARPKPKQKRKPAGKQGSSGWFQGWF